MTRKQIKKYASKILALEKIHQDPESSDKDKREAENGILQLTNLLMAMPDGVNILMDIDDLVQRQLNNEGE